MGKTLTQAVPQSLQPPFLLQRLSCSTGSLPRLSSQLSTGELSKDAPLTTFQHLPPVPQQHPSSVLTSCTPRQLHLCSCSAMPPVADLSSPVLATPCPQHPQQSEAALLLQHCSRCRTRLHQCFLELFYLLLLGCSLVGSEVSS